MKNDIEKYNQDQTEEDGKICTILYKELNACLPNAESKLWHGHPVWFLEENPVAGYSKLKSGIQLLFWSGQSFEEDKLQAMGKFKAAGIEYKDAKEIHVKDVKRWLKKAKDIQWDYKNIVKNKGKLSLLK